MSFIIVTRNPGGGGLVIINDLKTESDWAARPAEFATAEQAEKVANKQTLCKAWGYEILEVNV